MLNVKIKYHTEKYGELPKLKKIDQGDWIDMYSAEDYTIKKGEDQLISLGVSMEIPEGYEAHLAPRSSTFKKWGILQTNSQGIIDNSYSGDNDIWLFPALAVRDTEIKKGDRICQFRLFKKMETLEFNEVDHLGNADRGGFGSTGSN